MTVTTQDVAALRQRTGAGMMDCKKALMESGGDFEQAIDLLRKKGKKIATDRAVRSAMEGVVFAATDADARVGFLLGLHCETDFVAKNVTFLQLGQRILDVVVLHQPATVAALSTLPLGDGTVQDAVVASIGTIGENIVIAAYEKMQGDVVVPYVHAGNNLGVLVALQGTVGDAAYTIGKDIAMQVAAMAPIALDRDQVDPSVVAREKAIIQEQVMAEGHSGDKAEKIIQGRLHKFFQESTLLWQPFVKNTKLTVGQYLQSVVPPLQVVGFKRLAVKG